MIEFTCSMLYTKGWWTPSKYTSIYLTSSNGIADMLQALVRLLETERMNQGSPLFYQVSKWCISNTDPCKTSSIFTGRSEHARRETQKLNRCWLKAFSITLISKHKFKRGNLCTFSVSQVLNHLSLSKNKGVIMFCAQSMIDLSKF